MRVLDIGYVELIDSMGNDKSIVNAARVSLNKDSIHSPFDEDDEKLIRYLLVHKHTSPLEHVVFTFLVKCPLFVRSQWHRHRTWSYNEVSRRYTSEDIDFYIPDNFRKQAENNRQASTEEELLEIKARDDEIYSIPTYVNSLSTLLYHEYMNLIAQGVCREQARMILPQNMYTRFYATVDLWNLLHFIEVREDNHSQYEMQLYGKAVKDIAKVIVPATMQIWESVKNK